jgi:hypothetical protein
MRRLALPLVVVLFAACGREAPTAPEKSLAPSLSFINNPDNGNPRIIRYTTGVGFLQIDPKTRLFSLQAATNRQMGCNVPPQFISLMDVQDILHNPDDPLAGQINELIIGKDIYIAVYQGWDEWAAGGFDCNDLFARKVAEGFNGNFRYTDNDLFTFLRDHNNQNAFGFVSQGKLNRVGGGTAQYNAIGKCVWDGVDFTNIKCVDRINFR